MTNTKRFRRILQDSAICHLSFVICHSDYLGLRLLSALALAAGGPLPVVAADEVIQVTNRAVFAPTVPNQTPAPPNTPKGMVWIPGGEFSMGCQVPSEGACTMATMNSVNDTQPIHRVYVNGF